MNSTLSLSRHLFQGALASRILPLFFLLLCLSGSASAQELFRDQKNAHFQEISSSSIQLNKKTIQASSIQDQYFPLLVSSKINKIGQSSRNPIDLVCVFELEYEAYDPSSYPKEQIEEIQTLFKHLLPSMTDQDGLAVVLFGNPSDASKIGDMTFLLPITEIPSLTNTSTQNWENIILTIGEKMVEQYMSTERALEAAAKILGQRNKTNRTTGVFISTPNLEARRFGVREDRTMEDIDWAKECLELQDKGWIVQTFQGKPKELAQEFAESLLALRAGVVETKFLLKAEEPDLLKGVEIQGTYSLFLPSGKWSFEEDGALSLRSPSPKREEDFFFDLKIPKITQDLPSSPIEVKVASYQVTFVLEDGSQVVKNADLTVKIVREGEKIADEKENQEFERSFYHKWGEDWLLPTARNINFLISPERGREMLKRYKKCLDDSLVKDDEILQNLWKETEKEINEHEESGSNSCW